MSEAIAEIPPTTTAVGATPRQSVSETPYGEFQSILSPDGDRFERAEAPLCFADTNLDQLFTSVCAGFEHYNLLPIFQSEPLTPEVVRFRQAIGKDLESPAVAKVVRSYTAEWKAIEEHLKRMEKMSYPLQQQRVFLDVVNRYCVALTTFARQMQRISVTSPGLWSLGQFLQSLVNSRTFLALRAEMQAIDTSLSALTYGLLIGDGAVTVQLPPRACDYGAEVAGTFDRFRQGNVKSYDFRLTDYFDMNHLEAGILGNVAKLYPEPFARLGDFYAKHRDFADARLVRFSREVQFFLSYQAFIKPLTVAGLNICYPDVVTDTKTVFADDTYDLPLAGKLVGNASRVVTNTFEMHGDERIFVVSGPNQGGKTTFARTFGQLNYLARLGLPVAGSRAQLFFYDHILTHFEKQESIHNHRGKLEDDLVRVHDILKQATPASVVILNEIFSSTTLRDALFLADRILDQLITLDCLVVCVTFMDELSTRGPSVVSMVSTVSPDNPSERTFRVERKKADGRAYAVSIAEKYHVTYEALNMRLPL